MTTDRILSDDPADVAALQASVKASGNWPKSRCPETPCVLGDGHWGFHRWADDPDPRDAVLDDMHKLVREMAERNKLILADLRAIRKAVQTDGDAAVEILARDGV